MTPRPASSAQRSDDRDFHFAGLTVDRKADVPIGVQLAWALRSRIDEGQLVPGQRLPGLRELADATGVNVNTARAVYQRLEQEGLIDSQQGSGTFVATDPPPRSAIGAIAASAALEAHETGVDPRAVAAALYAAPPPADDTEDRDERAAHRRRLLRAQIAVLERTLTEMEASYPGVAPASAPIRAGVGPALLSAEQLEQVRAHLVRRLATVQVAIDGGPAAQDGQLAADNRVDASPEGNGQLAADDTADASPEGKRARTPKATKREAAPAFSRPRTLPC